MALGSLAVKPTSASRARRGMRGGQTTSAGPVDGWLAGVITRGGKEHRAGKPDARQPVTRPTVQGAATPHPREPGRELETDRPGHAGDHHANDGVARPVPLMLTLAPV